MNKKGEQSIHRYYVVPTTILLGHAMYMGVHREPPLVSKLYLVLTANEKPTTQLQTSYQVWKLG